MNIINEKTDWRITDEGFYYYEISDNNKNKYWIAWVQKKKDAEKICKAVNNYDSLLEENSKLKRLLEDLTPGGSEFVNDPEYCAKWAKEYMQSVPKQVLPFKQKADKLNKVNDSLLEALEEHHTFLSLLIGSSSLERIERFDLLEKARELFHKAEIQKAPE